jgi:hypothetical protein
MDFNSLIPYQLVSQWSRLEGESVELLLPLLPNNQGHAYVYRLVLLVIIPPSGAQPIVSTLWPRDLDRMPSFTL